MREGCELEALRGRIEYISWKLLEEPGSSEELAALWERPPSPGEAGGGSLQLVHTLHSVAYLYTSIFHY